MPRPQVFGFQRADTLSRAVAVLAVLDTRQVDWSSAHAEADPSQEEGAEGLEQHHLSHTLFPVKWMQIEMPTGSKQQTRGQRRSEHGAFKVQWSE